MASPAEQREFAQDAADARADIIESGKPLSFGVLTPSVEPDGPAGPYQEIGTSHAIPISGADFRVNKLSDVDPADQFFLVTNETNLRDCEYMQENGRLYKIHRLDDAYNFDGITDIIFFVQVRR